jgi:dienelactone hydrolase
LGPSFLRAGIVFVHWGEGDRTEFVADALALAESSCVSILVSAPSARPAASRSPDVVTEREQYLQTVVDVLRAIDWLVARDDVDRARLAFVGHSFGAHIGGILAAVDGRPRAYVLMGGVASLTRYKRTMSYLAVAEARATTAPPNWERYLASLEPLDAERFLPRARAAAFLFQ